jgi:hypothetical protein
MLVRGLNSSEEAWDCNCTCDLRMQHVDVPRAGSAVHAS